jgi:hypothetical protein
MTSIEMRAHRNLPRLLSHTPSNALDARFHMSAARRGEKLSMFRHTIFFGFYFVA